MNIDPDNLEGLIGRRVNFRGRELLIVEVLQERPAIVLTEPGGAGSIQANQFGEAARRAPRSWTIPVTEPGGELHPMMRELTLA